MVLENNNLNGLYWGVYDLHERPDDAFLSEWVQNIEQPNYLALDVVQASAIDQLQKWNKNGLNVYLVTMRNNKNNLLDQLNATGLKQYLASVIICVHSKDVWSTSV